MKKAILSEMDLYAIIRKLTDQIRQGEDKSGIYVCFKPENVFINSKGEVQCEKFDVAESGPEALYQLGLTLYHLATGNSPLNRKLSMNEIENFKFEPFESQYWPLVELLLSKHAVSMPQVLGLISAPSYRKRVARKLAPVGGFFLWLLFGLLGGCRLAIAWTVKKIAGAGKAVGQKISQRTKTLRHWLWQNLLKITGYAMFIPVIIALMFLMYGGITYQNMMFLIFFILSALASAILGALIGTAINEFTKDEESATIIGWITGSTFFVCLSVCLSILNPLVYESGVGSPSANLICVDRQTNKFVGFMTDQDMVFHKSDPDKEAEKKGQFKATFINPFRYKMVSSLTPRGKIEAVINYANKSRYSERLATIEITYNITDPESYKLAYNTFSSDEALREAVVEYLAGQSEPFFEPLNLESYFSNRASGKIADLKVEISCGSDVLKKEDLEKLKDDATSAATEQVKKNLAQNCEDKFHAAREQISDALLTDLKEHFAGALGEIEITELALTLY